MEGLMTRRFKDPRLQRDYDTARQHHDKCMFERNAAFRAYRVGYSFPDRLEFAPERSSVAYAYWAAGVDNRKEKDRKRKLCARLMQCFKKPLAETDSLLLEPSESDINRA